MLDRNREQAAIRAGYAAKTAYSIGQENLKKPEVAKAVETAIAGRARKLQMEAKDIHA